MADWRDPWAKAPFPQAGERRMWLPLHTHLTDAGTVVRLLWDEWVGARIRAVITQDAGGDDRVAREIAVLAGALHDVGKATRAFAGQVREMQVEMERRGFTWAQQAIAGDSTRLQHAVAGAVIIGDYLRRQGVPIEHADAFAAVIGGHHGVPPTRDALLAAEDADQWLGRGEWDEAREGLIDHVIQDLGLEAALDSLRSVRLSDASQMLITAIVIMADWIASNAEYFPLVPAWDDVVDDSTRRARCGWDALRLPRPWQPTSEALTSDATELLRSRFEASYEANDVQRLALDAARGMSEPGLILIEAVMGVGKTEASLLAAEVLAAKFGCCGVFYGLPTRATADAMFERVLTWWRNVPGGERDEGDRGLALRHGTASLNETYRALPRRVWAKHSTDGEAPLASGHMVDVGRDTPEAGWGRGHRTESGAVVAHYWTSGRKQASFADTVIATIDHELLAALASRHVVLRHLGLARQVVILDEIHSADTWMQVYLERALQWLGRYGVPVIAMSATLEPALRQALIDAYESGRRAGLRNSGVREPDDGVPRRRISQSVAPIPRAPESDQYPLVTTLSGGSLTQRSALPLEPREVELGWLCDDLDELERAVAPVVDAGGCVLVVCNTVRRAVERYRALQAAWGDRVTLAHSRFIARDRLENDTWLRTTFGKRAGDRAGRVVVSSQLAPQSLDVAFVLLATDLAPVDLVLQRIGRLHRHPGRWRPDCASVARCLVIAGQELPAVVVAPEVDRGSAKVYGAYHLLRSAALLNEAIWSAEPLVLPEQVPSLVRRCYGREWIGPETWRNATEDAYSTYCEEMASIKNAAGLYRLRGPGERSSTVGLLEMNAGEAESSAGIARAVRNTDGGFEVILLEQAEDGLRLLPQFQDDRRIPTDVRPDRETAVQLARSMVRVPGWITSNPTWTNQVLDDLTRNYFKEWQKDPVLSGQLVLILMSDGTGTMGPFAVKYDNETGLEVLRA